MLAEMERGADAVGGIPSTWLKGAGLLPHIRATVKLPMIVMKRTLQQLLGGAPFIISGACGMFRTDVLRKFGFSDRTKVEDLDLTWTLVANGYRIRQANRCIVYPCLLYTSRPWPCAGAAAAQLCSPLCCGRGEPQHQVRSTIHRHARICFKPRI